MKKISQNYHEECAKAINDQINKELYASYVYLSMAYNFDRHDLALPGLYKYFKKASDEEREHAMKFMKYQNKRGGDICLEAIKPPVTVRWDTPLSAMEEALELEKDVNESLLQLHETASNHKDANLMDFLETEFLQEQVDSIKEIADYVTQLDLVGEGLGIYVFDKELSK